MEGEACQRQKSKGPARPPFILTRVGKVLEVAQGSPSSPLTLLKVAVNGKTGNAVFYNHLPGEVFPGDTVLLNSCGVDLPLGTGGVYVAMAVLSRNCQEEKETFPEVEPGARSAGGKVVKLRYTPFQLVAHSIEEGSPYQHHFQSPLSLRGLPVLVLPLHSLLLPVAFAFKGICPGLKVVYLMGDGGALPLAFSRTVPLLLEKGYLDSTITYGHAFGGEYEAVNLYTALQGAKEALQADLVVVGCGPGGVGTGTHLGFSGAEQGLIVNVVGESGGVPVLVPRISFSDPRERHRGISHHTLTVLSELTSQPALLPLPSLPPEKSDLLYRQLMRKDILSLHWVVEHDVQEAWEDFHALITAFPQGIVETMGRNPDQDQEFFLSGLAAGHLASKICHELC